MIFGCVAQRYGTRTGKEGMEITFRPGGIHEKVAICPGNPDQSIGMRDQATA
jgi:hypothetical protein